MANGPDVVSPAHEREIRAAPTMSPKKRMLMDFLGKK